MAGDEMGAEGKRGWTIRLEDKKGALLLVAILMVGLLTLPPYGFYLDQTNEQRILFANVKEYLLHLPGEPPKLVQDLTDFKVLAISIDEDRDHGMAVYYPAFVVWYLNQLSPYAGSLFWHTYTFLIVFWGMCSLYGLGKALFGSRKLAAFLVLLFFLTPRMFAESHYNNKDMVLLSLYFTIFYWGKRLMKEQSTKNLCMFAFCGALAANMKIIGVWTFGMIGLYLFFYFLITGQLHKELLGKAAGCILLWAVLFILLTPACWTDPAAFFQYLFSNAVNYELWHDYVLFGGRMLRQEYTGMPRKYLPVLITLTTPVGILLLTGCGCLWAAVDFVRKKGKCLENIGYVLVILFAGAVPLAYAVLMATPLYNGWRHFYFVYASMMMGAGYGAFRIWQVVRARGGERYVNAAAVLYLLVLAVGIAVNYPQEHSYYNVLAGKNVVERYELDYWDMSIKQACESVLEHLEERELMSAKAEPVDGDEGIKLKVGALNLPTSWGVEGNLKLLPKRYQGRLFLVDDWREAEYILVNTTYAYMYTWEEYQWVKEHYTQIDSFTSYGNVICEVYYKSF